MPFQIVHNDITKMKSDAIVNAANSGLKQGGGVCGAIFQAAGVWELTRECDKIGSCPVGQAVITKGYQLPAKYIIHAVGPVWNGGGQGEEKLLAMAYRSSLELAKEYHLTSVSFPLLSSGIYGYPKDEALQIAIAIISEFLLHNDMDIYLVVFDRKSISLSEKLFHEINHYIETYYEDSEGYGGVNRQNEAPEAYNPIPKKTSPGTKKVSLKPKQENLEPKQERLKPSKKNRILEDKVCNFTDTREESVCYSCFDALPRSLEDVVKQMEETFSEMLLRLIDEKGKTDVEIYKKANIDRKLFSKIRGNKDYQPKKSTAIALAISLELSLDETKDLLIKSGYSLSPSNRFDVIIRYFIEHRSYDMYVINEALFAYDQPLLGA